MQPSPKKLKSCLELPLKGLLRDLAGPSLSKSSWMITCSLNHFLSMHQTRQKVLASGPQKQLLLTSSQAKRSLLPWKTSMFFPVLPSQQLPLSMPSTVLFLLKPAHLPLKPSVPFRKAMSDCSPTVWLWSRQKAHTPASLWANSYMRMASWSLPAWQHLPPQLTLRQLPSFRLQTMV